jgi:site-specific recombinase XerD
MEGFCLSLVWKYKRGKYWYLAYARSLGQPTRSLKTDNTRLAETIRAKEENDYILARAGVQQMPSKAIRLSLLAEQFLDYKRIRNIAEGTIRLYVRIFNSFGKFLKKDYRTNQITRELINKYMAHRQDVSPKTLRNEIGMLSSVFRWAIKYGYANINPCLDVDLPKLIKTPPIFLSQSQYKKLHKSIPNKFDRALLDFYILTGCRKSEATAIEIKKHLDLDKRLLTIPQAKQNDFRRIYIHDQLLEAIKTLLNVKKSNGCLIPLKSARVYKRLKKYMKDAGLGHLKLHSLRHTFGTWLAKEGVPLRDLQELMGHHDPRSTLVYVHPFSSSTKANLKKLKLPK